MRKLILAATLLIAGVSLSGCWHDRYGHHGAGYPSDRHHGHY